MTHRFFPFFLAFTVGCGGAPTKPPADLRCATAVGQDAHRPDLARPEVPEDDAPIPITKSDPSWGSRDALVTVVEFSDFQCPFCARANVTMSRLKEVYGPELRVIWKNEPLPFHDKARPAAEFSQGVFALGGNDAFWKWHDAAFRGQAALSVDAFATWARDAGVDADSVLRGLDAHTWAEKVDGDHALGTRIGVLGTPAFYINGVALSGAQPFEAFQQIIEQELTRAKGLLAGGTPRERVYVAASTTNFKEAPPRAPDDVEKEDTRTVFKIPVGQSPTLGNATAQVTLIEFGDFQCPYTRRAEERIRALRAKYGSKLRIVWKDEPLPFHDQAEAAAELAREARAEKGDAGFWAAHDKLLDPSLILSSEVFTRIAGEVGLHAAKVKAALATRAQKRGLDQDADQAEDFGVRGTPHFFVNGRSVVGLQPLEKFQAIVDEEIAATDALLASGIAPSKVYETRIKNGVVPVEIEPEQKTVAVDPKAPWKGSAAAKVVIQEFSDFQCPFCQRVQATLDEVMKEYGTRVKLVWRNMPLAMHPDAARAAEASMEAFAQKGNDGFWKMHDLLFQNQGELGRDALDGYARKMTLDMTKWKASLDGDTQKPVVDADAKAGGDGHMNGTPSFLINGYFLSGAQPYARFRRLIDRALADTARR